MKSYVGVGVSVGVLAGLWTQVSVQIGLVTWVAFIAWACYFAAGGGFTGFRKVSRPTSAASCGAGSPACSPPG